MTANDSDVSDGDTLTGSQVVRVYGENLTTPFVTLTFGGVEYIPLAQGEDYIEFILTDNGTATINVDGNSFMSFEVEGITRPLEMTGRVSANLRTASGSSKPDGTEIVENGCLNYAHMVDETYVKYFLGVYFTDVESISQSDFSAVNASLSAFDPNTPTGRMGMIVTPTDASQPIYVLYKDFIVFVSNYTTE